MLHAKNYLNWPMFHRVIHKITLAQFFSETRCTRLHIHQYSRTSTLPYLTLPS